MAEKMITKFLNVKNNIEDAEKIPSITNVLLRDKSVRMEPIARLALQHKTKEKNKLISNIKDIST